MTERNWKGAFHVDADHITRDTVTPFLPHADFFTLDVSEHIGRPPDPALREAFLTACSGLRGEQHLRGRQRPLSIEPGMADRMADRFLGAIAEADGLYRRIAGKRAKIPSSRKSPWTKWTGPRHRWSCFSCSDDWFSGNPRPDHRARFSGQFLKGVDYVGDPALFRREFEDDLLVVAHAVREFGLPGNLKLSIHSGSDKFSIYPVMGELVQTHQAGLHVKTAGTTWLEEVIGLALAGGDALDLVRDIYAGAHARRESLCAPYAHVVRIDPARLPAPSEFRSWNGTKVADALRHCPECPGYRSDLRPLFHVGYKLAAEAGSRFLDALNLHRDLVAEQVRTNLYDRHIARLFNLT
ncbi:MAG: tagaturonate epimerase family protein [Bacteroidales bacterium]